MIYKFAYGNYFDLLILYYYLNECLNAVIICELYFSGEVKAHFIKKF